MASKRSTDVLVVGTGPAGAAFARVLRSRSPDVRILALERQAHPREKVCGDALTFLSLPLIREVFPDIDSIPSQSFTRRYRFVFPNGQSVTGTDGQLDVVPRQILDERLWRSAAEAGIEVLENTAVVSLRREEGRVIGVTAERDGERLEIDAALVIGADGSTSVVRQATAPHRSKSSGVAVRQYVSGLATSHRELVFLIDPDRGGYLWIFPFQSAGQAWANIGYFCHTSSGVNPRAGLEAMRAHPVARGYLDGTTIESAPRGFPLNLAASRRGVLTLDRPAWGPGFVLIGDAAGLVEPHTGEGISFALHSGLRAAERTAQNLDVSAWGSSYEAEVVAFARASYPTNELRMVFDVPHRLPAPLRALYMRLLPWWISRRYKHDAAPA